MSASQKVYICNAGGEGKPVIDQVFYMNLSPTSSARLISHPVEDGTKVFDNKVTEPDRISVRGEISYSNSEAFATLNKMLAEKAFKFYALMTLGDFFYDNLSLVRLSHTQQAENPDTAEVTIEFQELLRVKPQQGSPTPEDPANASTQRH